MIAKQYTTNITYVTVRNEIVRETFESSVASLAKDVGLSIAAIIIKRGKVLLVNTFRIQEGEVVV